VAKPGTETIYGRNPVYEVIRAGRRRVHKLQLAEGVQPRGNLRRALELAGSQGIPIETVGRAVLERIADNHQGIAAVVEKYPYSTAAEILEQAASRREPPLVLLLDALQDPQNLGTLLRTGEAVGVHGVIIPPRHSVGVTQAVVSASAGACEHLLIATENLARAIQTLKEAGLWIVGLENSPEAVPLGEADLGGPLGLVVGNEAEGMRRLVREGCDYLVRLPMRGRVESLNAAVAGSLALYAAWQARGYAGASGRPEEGRSGAE
jgi:23S rRNA (guanosine2251-2'-O)-methyltransferase